MSKNPLNVATWVENEGSMIPCKEFGTYKKPQFLLSWRKFLTSGLFLSRKRILLLHSSREEKLGNLKSQEYRLKREITITVYFEEDQWFAEFQDLDLIGVGDEDWQAIDDLRQHLVDTFEELVHCQFALAEHLKTEKAFLLDIMEER
jgi:hypothetical protein